MVSQHVEPWAGVQQQEEIPTPLPDKGGRRQRVASGLRESPMSVGEGRTADYFV